MGASVLNEPHLFGRSSIYQSRVYVSYQANLILPLMAAASATRYLYHLIMWSINSLGDSVTTARRFLNYSGHSRTFANYCKGRGWNVPKCSWIAANKLLIFQLLKINFPIVVVHMEGEMPIIRSNYLNNKEYLPHDKRGILQMIAMHNNGKKHEALIGKLRPDRSRQLAFIHL